MKDKLQLAIGHHQRGELDRAETLYREIVAEAGPNFDALRMLGLLRYQQGKPAEAVELLHEALKVNPNVAGVHSNLGLAFQSLDRWDQALACYERAVALDPSLPEALNNLGTVLWHLRRYEDALACYERALALRPDYPEALSNRGDVLQERRRYEEAIASYDRSIALQPDSADTFSNRGNALYSLGRLDDALASYDRALTLRPEFPDALNNRANSLRDLHRHDEAIASFARLLKLSPSFPFVKGQLFHSRMLCCEWKDFAVNLRSLESDVREGRQAAEPFGYQALSNSERDLQLCAETFVAARFPQSSQPLWVGERYDHPKIRLGYISGEFQQQATSILITRLFELHDRERFELVAFDNGWSDGSDIRRRIDAAFEEIVDVSRMDDRRAAAIIRAKQIDILVNLNGYFGRARQGIFRHRPSPIQVNYLGFPGTLGASYIDYIIADRHVIPAGHDRFYTEKVAILPNTYQVNDSRRSPVGSPPSRADVGLPDSAFVFCCFNNNYKIVPDMFELWMRVLRQVAGSVLWLLEDSQAATRNLRREAQQRGMAIDRLVFAPRLALDRHLARHRLGDLFLDTLPYNAHTTASDALWAGLPVLSCVGSTFPARVGASLLHAVGLPELIASSQDEYEAMAVRLATEPAALAEIRAKLERNRTSCALFDTETFRRHLEAAYIMMWDRYRAGQPPESFAVPLLS